MSYFRQSCKRDLVFPPSWNSAHHKYDNICIDSAYNVSIRTKTECGQDKENEKVSKCDFSL